MVWIVSIVALFALWIASLRRILHHFPPPSAFLKDGGVSNVMLVIAHPDDESMFFAPTINHLISRGHNLHILCISTGNFDGLGSIRRNELYLASDVLRIPSHHVKVLDHPELKDGFGQIWNSDLLSKIIAEETRSHSIDLLVTFDRHGVSGHCNHCDLNKGVRKLLHSDSGADIQAWELVSNSIVRKYIGPVGVLMERDGETVCLANRTPMATFAAMAQHSCQWVWFRKLFVAFSSYTYYNTLRKIE